MKLSPMTKTAVAAIMAAMPPSSEVLFMRPERLPPSFDAAQSERSLATHFIDLFASTLGPNALPCPREGQPPRLGEACGRVARRSPTDPGRLADTTRWSSSKHPAVAGAIRLS